MTDLPEGFTETFIQSAGIQGAGIQGVGVQLHVVHNCAADDQRPAIICLHGFPEFWTAWREVFLPLGETHRVIAPDQRGFNLSDAPKGRENYRTGLMVADLMAVADHLLGDMSFVLCGHDWGASVAYAAAIKHADRISKLVIANGVHPVPFQNALIDDPAQREASQYMRLLASERGPDLMAEDDFRRTFSMFEKFSATPWLDAHKRAEYLDAWSRPERMEAMLHWYGSSPLFVPPTDMAADEARGQAPLYHGDVARFQIKMPHLLIWGMRDQALLPVSTRGLEAFAPKLKRVELGDGDHWLLHTHGPKIAEEIAAFLR